jgi:DNA-binding CsgD family transcriptional regulator/tetratricopeptide (TPR) repeat protein
LSDLAIHLLGPPRIEQAGEARSGPRGRLAWGVLAYLLLAERPPSHDELVAQIFAAADDPRGGLRASLAALRRALPGATVEGDPVRLTLPPGTFVDVEMLKSGAWDAAVAVPGNDSELLGGLDFSAAPAFALWIQDQRRHLAAIAEAVQREAALASRAAAEAAAAASARTSVSGRVAALAQLEAGEAAIAAGALESGLECLRRAVAEARDAAAPSVQARALVALGSALVHAARGRDEDAAPALHEALELASRADLPSVAAAAARELGYVEFLRARYERAERWLVRADTLAAGDPGERGHIASVLGSVLSDTAQYSRAREELDRGMQLSTAAGDTRRAAYTLSMLGRLHMLRGELTDAADSLDASLRMARAENWAAFTPWPEALRADVDLLHGAVDVAAERYEHAFALGCQLGDPCWEGAGARGIGLIAAARGEVDQAVEWLEDARHRCARLPDAYLWVEAYTLDALCGVGVEHGLRSTAGWIDELATLTARSGMRELAARAYLHRAALGDASARTAAEAIAAGIESPALDALLAGRPIGGAPRAPSSAPPSDAAQPALRRGRRASTRNNPAGLTSRELEVLALVADGQRNAQIAERLVLSEKTVGHHVSAILRKLNAATRTEAVAEATRLGAIQR